MNSATMQGLVALVFISVLIASTVGAFLSGLFFMPLCAYRDSILRREGFTGVSDVIRLTRRGEASRSTLLYHICLLAFQVFLGSSSILFLCAGLSFPPVMESLCLGGLLGCCINKFSQMFYTSVGLSHPSLDKCVFVIVYICCCIVYAHLRINYTSKRFFVDELILYRNIATGFSLGTLVSYVCMKTSRRWIVLPVVSLACAYLIFVVFRQGKDVDMSSIGLFALNMFLGLLVGRGMIVRNNPLSFVTCVVTVCLVWVCLIIATINSAGIFPSVTMWKKMEMHLTETALCFIVCLCLCGFLMERGLSSNVALVVMTCVGILFNFVNVKTWAYIVRE